MSKKFQIFISSTYDDLREAREEVIKAVLEMGHIPVGMEMFSAADEDQWRTISRTIAESDYYIVIVAHRYGSEVAGISFTEREYDYAVSNNVPVLGFVIEENAPWPASKIDRDAAKQTKLVAFKQKVMRKPIGFWGATRDLYGKAPIALEKLFKTNPRDGWIRSAGALAGSEQIKEIRRKRSIHVSFDHRVTSYQIPFDRSYHRTIRTAILGDEEFGTENKIDYQIGRMTTVHVHLGEAANEQADIYDVFDETQQLLDLGKEIYDFKENDLNAEVRGLVGDSVFVSDVLLIDSLIVYSRFRGHSIGLGALHDLMWNFGGINCLVALYVEPMQHSGAALGEADKSTLAEFSVSESVARQKLAEHFIRLGFKRVRPRSNLMILSLSNKQPEISEFGFHGYLEI